MRFSLDTCNIILLLLLLHCSRVVVCRTYYCGAKQFINVVYIYECNTRIPLKRIYIYHSCRQFATTQQQPIYSFTVNRLRTNTHTRTCIHIVIYILLLSRVQRFEKRNLFCYTYIYMCASMRISLSLSLTLRIVRALLDKSPIANSGDSTQISR